MNKEFITLKEAGKLVGVSPMTIRRYAFRLLRSKNESLRADVKEPSKTNHPYKIAKDRVMRKFGKEEVKESYTNNKADVKEGLTKIDNNLLQTLTEQLKVKDDQIKAKDEQINSLNERLRESHILLLGQPKTTPEPTVFNEEEKRADREPEQETQEPEKEPETTSEEPITQEPTHEPEETENTQSHAIEEETERQEEEVITPESEEPKKKSFLDKLFG